jgi:hypothetical protein
MHICSSHELLMNPVQRTTFDEVYKYKGLAAAWEAVIKGGGEDRSDRWTDFPVYEPEDDIIRLKKMKTAVEVRMTELSAKKEDLEVQLQNLRTVKDDTDAELVVMKRKNDELEGELRDLETQVAGRKRIRITDDDPCANILFACEICGTMEY